MQYVVPQKQAPELAVVTFFQGRVSSPEHCGKALPSPCARKKICSIVVKFKLLARGARSKRKLKGARALSYFVIARPTRADRSRHAYAQRIRNCQNSVRHWYQITTRNVTETMDGYAFSSCDLARLAEVSGLNVENEDTLPSEERIRQNIIQVQLLAKGLCNILRVFD